MRSSLLVLGVVFEPDCSSVKLAQPACFATHVLTYAVHVSVEAPANSLFVEREPLVPAHVSEEIHSHRRLVDQSSDGLPLCDDVRFMELTVPTLAGAVALILLCVGCMQSIMEV